MKRVISTIVSGLLVLGLVLTLAPRTRAEDQPAANATGAIAGKVVDKEGKPIEKAKVRIAKAMTPKPAPTGGSHAEHNTAEQGPAKPTTLPAEATTDAQGAFTVEGLPAGDYNVLANAKGLNAKSAVHVDAGQTANVELKLEPKQPTKPPMQQPKHK